MRKALKLSNNDFPELLIGGFQNLVTVLLEKKYINIKIDNCKINIKIIFFLCLKCKRARSKMNEDIVLCAGCLINNYFEHSEKKMLG